MLKAKKLSYILNGLSSYCVGTASESGHRYDLIIEDRPRVVVGARSNSEAVRLGRVRLNRGENIND